MWQLMAAVTIVPFFLGIGPKLRVLSVLVARRKEEVKRTQNKQENYTAKRSMNGLVTPLKLKIPFASSWKRKDVFDSEPSSPSALRYAQS